jgi:ATP-binding cassette subfamily B protein
MAEDVSRVRMFTGPAIMYFINLATLISLSVYFMLRRDVELTLYVLSPLPLLAGTIYYVNTIIHRKSEALQAALGQLTTTAQQSYSGIRVIKSFVQERAMHRAFEESSENYRSGAVGLARVESLYFPSMTLADWSQYPAHHYDRRYLLHHGHQRNRFGNDCGVCHLY